MKRFSLIISIVLALALVGGGFVYAHDHEGVNKDVKLSDDQKQELETMYVQLYDQHNKIIDKYVEYGVYTAEKAEKMKKKMSEGHDKLKENGYIPVWERHKDKKDDEEKSEDSEEE